MQTILKIGIFFLFETTVDALWTTKIPVLTPEMEKSDNLGIENIFLILIGLDLVQLLLSQRDMHTNRKGKKLISLTPPF